MMEYHWDPVKDAWLRRVRSISFEDVVWAIAHDGLLDVLISTNARYRGQKQLVVRVKAYVHLVPIVEEGDRVILKTVIPSRKLTKAYLRKGAGDGSADS